MAAERSNHGAFVLFDAAQDVGGANLGTNRKTFGALEELGWLANDDVCLKGGLYIARTDGGGSDATLIQFHAEPVSEAEESGLGCGVEREPGERNEAGNGRDIDDGAVALCEHLRKREAGEMDGCVEVELVEVCPGCVVDVDGRSIGADAGIVNEDIDAS